MNLRSYARFPWLDLWILPTFALIAWAIFRLSRAEPEIAKADQNAHQIQAAFGECQKWIKEGVEDFGVKRRESDRAWLDMMSLRDELRSLAERLESSVPQLEKALDASASRKGADDRQRFLQEFNQWIDREKERIRVERLGSKAQELQDRLATAKPSEAANHPNMGPLVEDIRNTFQQYLSDARIIEDNSGKPLVGRLVSAHTASAHQAVRQLAGIAQKTRAELQALEGMLQTATGKELSSGAGRRREIQEALLATGSPAEFARRIGTGQAVPDHYSPSITASAVRTVRYGLLATLAALAAFVLIDVYRRMVVAPLRLKLVEREGLIEHQKKLAHFEELAAGLAHEIRNPLTAISARLYTIQRKLREGTPEYQDASVIGGEIERANQILKEFIQVTRPSPPRLELITAGPLLQDVSHIMTPQLESKAVRLQVQLPAQTQFYGDQQQLKQVLVNLVQNAAESMNDGGEVILRAREGRVPFKGSLTRAAIIEVQDNGPGIRPEIRDRLFEPFFSTKKEGTGLGLPISARIIDRHGGTLDFETQPERGTIFRIVLPSHE